MPVGELFINGKDAYLEWGVSMDNTSLSALITPAPNKAVIANKSRLEHGKRLITSNVMVDERDLTLQINLTARNKEEFFKRYIAFCDELAKGLLLIKTKYQPNIVYKTVYNSCTQFSQFIREIASFSLKLTEPNPKDRK